MIKLTQLNGTAIVINIDNIEIVEEVPHTVITMASNKKFVVLESSDEIIQKSVEYKARALSAAVSRGV